MNEDRNQDGLSQQQAQHRVAGQNIGSEAGVRGGSKRTAFHLRRSGMRLRGDDDG